MRVRDLIEQGFRYVFRGGVEQRHTGPNRARRLAVERAKEEKELRYPVVSHKQRKRQKARRKQSWKGKAA